MRFLDLTRGEKTLVDNDIYEKFRYSKLQRSKDGYAIVYRDRKNTRLHRLILGAKPGEIVDHANRNKLDNRRRNLRLCNKSENGVNSDLRRNNTSGYKGVTQKRGRATWEAQIYFKGKHIFLGGYRDKKEAARAYNKKAVAIFGKFAKLNMV